MALVVGQNSWVTIAEADTYFTSRLDSEDWFLLSDIGSAGELSKTTLLASSYYWLIKHPSLELSSSLTDDDVKNAQIEFAAYLQEHYDEWQSRGALISSGVESFRLSKWQETLRDGAGGYAVPALVLGMLRSYNVSNSVVTLLGPYDE